MGTYQGQQVPSEPSPTPQAKTDASVIVELQKQVKALIKKDGWANAFIALGGMKDKKTGTYHENDAILTDEELDSIYISDGLGSKIVNVVADDMTREWIDLEPDENDDTELDEEAKKQLTELMEALNIQESFNEALKWARLYGGALIIMGAKDGEKLETPFDPKKISKKGAVTNLIRNILGQTKVEGLGGLTVVNRRRVRLGTSIFQDDINKPNYGEIEQFDVEFFAGEKSEYVKVHASRCLIFKGVKVSASSRNILTIDQRYWGLSVLQSIYNSVRDYSGMMSSVSSLMYEFTIGKYKIANLVELLAQGQEDQLVTRMEIINMAKGIVNAVLLGEGEEYSRDSVSFAGVSDILSIAQANVSGYSGIPAHKLFSKMRTGLNADGGVEDNYYDTVKSEQQQKITPPLRRLYEVLSIVYGITPPPIKYKSLYQVDPKTEAETEKLKEDAAYVRAQKYGMYIDKQVLLPDEVYDLEWSETELGPRKEEPGLPPVPEPGTQPATEEPVQ